MDSGEFIDDEITWRPFLNANLEEPGEIPERALVSYEWPIVVPFKGISI